MKAGLFFLAAAGFATVQSVANLPQCAFKCVVQALPDVGCGIDYKCACKKMDKILETSAQCFADSCDSKELQQAQEDARKYCQSYLSSGSGSETATSHVVSATAAMSSPSSSDDPTGTKTSTGAKPTKTDGSGGGDSGDGEGAASKPALGLAAAVLAVLAAL